MNRRAPGKMLVAATVILSGGLISAAAYAWLLVQVQVQQLDEMRQRTAVLSEESNVWQRRWVEDIGQRDEQIARMEQALAGFRDAQQMKEQISQTQSRLARLESDYERIRREKESLEVANVGLNSRIANLTKEMTRTLDELKTARQQASGSQQERITAQLGREIESYKNQLNERDAAIAQVQSQLQQMRADTKRSQEEFRVQERRLAAAQQEKEKLLAKIDQVTRSYEARLIPVARLRERIRGLEKESAEKDTQRKLLEREMVKEEQIRRDLERKVQEAQNVAAELQSQAAAQVEAQQQQRQELESLRTEKTQLSFDVQTAQLRLNAQAQEIESLRQQLARVDTSLAMQQDARARLAEQPDSPRPRGERREDQEQAEPGTVIELSRPPHYQELSKAYALYDTAKAQVVKLSEMLMEREMDLERTRQQVAALQEQPSAAAGGDPAERTRQLQAKDIELAELRQLKVGLEQQVQTRENEYRELNTLTGRLKEQLSQMNEIVLARESEVLRKNSEILSVTAQLNRLQSDLVIKQRELEQVRQRQAMTLEELAKATRLNVMLQENLVQMYKGTTVVPAFVPQEDREKAEALRREVEKMLGR